MVIVWSQSSYVYMASYSSFVLQVPDDMNT
jgi:hypothetical protein